MTKQCITGELVNDIWLIKIDSQGNLLWDKAHGGRGSDKLTCFLPTNDGHFLLVGHTKSSKDGYLSSLNAGESDGLVIKIDPDGNVLWDRMYGGADYDELYNAITTMDGGYILAGKSSSVTLGQFVHPWESDAWAAKIDDDGQLEWQRAFGGANDDLFNNVVQLPSGNYLLAGHSSSKAGGNKTEENRGLTDIWAVEIDQTGELIWDKTFGHNHFEYLSSLSWKGNGVFMLAGSSRSFSGHEKSAPIIGDYDVWLINAKIDGQLCNHPLPPDRVCHESNILCNLDNYCSSLTTSQEADCQVAFCNDWIKAENVNYHSFRTGTSNLVLNIKIENCSNGQGDLGLEAAIFEDCTASVIVSNCWSTPGTDDFQLTANGLDVDSIYYLFIDGIDGCLCDYSIQVETGITGPSAPEVVVEEVISGCFENELLLDDNQLLSNGDVYLNWGSDNGRILSGEHTISPVVGEAGTYELEASHFIG
ncbi:MAG: hypothetical protein AAFZ15_34085 [Bacteroidota bacterium]